MQTILVHVVLTLIAPLLLAFAFFQSYARPYLVQTMCRENDQYCAIVRYRSGGNRFAAQLAPNLFRLYYDGKSLYMYVLPSYIDQDCAGGRVAVFRLNPRTCEVTYKECKPDFQTVFDSFDPVSERTTYARAGDDGEIGPTEVMQVMLDLKAVSFR